MLYYARQHIEQDDLDVCEVLKVLLYPQGKKLLNKKSFKKVNAKYSCKLSY